MAPMSDSELLQVAEERALAGKCGNPLCAQPFSWQGARPQYRCAWCSDACGWQQGGAAGGLLVL